MSAAKIRRSQDSHPFYLKCMSLDNVSCHGSRSKARTVFLSGVASTRTNRSSLFCVQTLCLTVRLFTGVTAEFTLLQVVAGFAWTVMVTVHSVGGVYDAFWRFQWRIFLVLIYQLLSSSYCSIHVSLLSQRLNAIRCPG